MLAFVYCVLTKSGDTTYDNDDLDDAIFRSCVSSFFHSFGKKSKNSSRRCNNFSPKIVKIRAALAIFWLFKDFRFFLFFAGGVLKVMSPVLVMYHIYIEDG